MVTKNQAKIIHEMMVSDTKIACETLGKTRDALYMSNTRVYKGFLEQLDLMIDNYPVFERRLTNDKTVLTKLRRLWRMTRKED